MAATKNQPPALGGLLCSAAALLGSPMVDAQIATETQIGFRFHSYSEDTTNRDLIFNTEKERYDIKVNQFSLLTPLSAKWELSFNAQHETMTGASPWYTFPNASNEIIQVMSGASIEDARTDGAVGVRYVEGNESLGATVATSVEDDYESVSLAIQYSFDTEDKMINHSLSIDASDDTVEPTLTNDIFGTRITSPEEKSSSSVLYSLTPVINKNTLMKFNFGYSQKKGFLSDPYKVVAIGDSGDVFIGDSRPDTRVANTAAFQLRYFSDDANGAFHLDYRYYEDNWEIVSNTFRIAWYQNLPGRWQVIPSIRVYNQTESFFYQIFYDQARNDGYHSTDYRLSEYGAITYGLKINKKFHSWGLTFSAEQYESGATLGIANSEQSNPGLLNFMLYTVGFDVTF